MEENGGRASQSFLAEMAPYLAGNEPQRVLDLAYKRLEAIPGDMDARAAICRALLLQGRVDEARGMIGTMESALSGLFDLYADVGKLYAKKGLDREAEVFYRKYAAFHPEAPLDWKTRSDNPEEPAILEDNDDLEGDEEGIVGVSAEFETPTLAALYLRQGHIEQAQEMLERIVARDPSNERARLLLIDARRMRGQNEEKQKNAVIVATLERWLARMERVRCHA